MGEGDGRVRVGWGRGEGGSSRQRWRPGRNQSDLAGFGDGGKGHGSRKTSGLWKLQKVRGQILPRPPEGTQTAHLVLAQGDPLATSCRQNYERIRLCCSSCELCYSSKRKPVQQGGGGLPGRSSGLGGAGAFPPRSRELLGPLPGERGRTDPCPAQLLMQLRGQPRLFPVPSFLMRGLPSSPQRCGLLLWVRSLTVGSG